MQKLFAIMAAVALSLVCLSATAVGAETDAEADVASGCTHTSSDAYTAGGTNGNTVPYGCDGDSSGSNPPATGAYQVGDGYADWLRSVCGSNFEHCPMK